MMSYSYNIDFIYNWQKDDSGRRSPVLSLVKSSSMDQSSQHQHQQLNIIVLKLILCFWLVYLSCKMYFIYFWLCQAIVDEINLKRHLIWIYLSRFRYLIHIFAKRFFFGQESFRRSVRDYLNGNLSSDTILT